VLVAREAAAEALSKRGRKVFLGLKTNTGRCLIIAFRPKHFFFCFGYL
jgi:hypothetical protein